MEFNEAKQSGMGDGSMLLSLHRAGTFACFRSLKQGLQKIATFSVFIKGFRVFVISYEVFKSTVFCESDG